VRLGSIGSRECRRPAEGWAGVDQGPGTRRAMARKRGPERTVYSTSGTFGGLDAAHAELSVSCVRRSP
jgi:hypothetical protein